MIVLTRTESTMQRACARTAITDAGEARKPGRVPTPARPTTPRVCASTATFQITTKAAPPRASPPTNSRPSSSERSSKRTAVYPQACSNPPTNHRRRPKPMDQWEHSLRTNLTPRLLQSLCPARQKPRHNRIQYLKAKNPTCYLSPQ